MRQRRFTYVRCVVSVTSIALTVGLLLIGATPAAEAGDLSATYFRMDVDDGVDTASFEVLSEDVEFDPVAQTWNWSGAGIPLDDIAVLDQVNLSIAGDPQVALSFSMTAGPADTTVTITSAVLSFDPLANPDALASAGLTLTETDGDTATLTGLAGDDGNAYEALYNVLPPGTVFAEFVPQLHEADAGGSTAASDSTGGWVTIPGSVSSMQAQFSFTLTAADQASGTSIYAIVPEPTSLILLAAGSLVVARRRR